MHWSLGVLDPNKRVSPPTTLIHLTNLPPLLSMHLHKHDLLLLYEYTQNTHMGYIS